jgi:iron complex outermembrane receptor protein
VPTILRPYALVNGSVTWHRGACDIAVFATNLLNKHYFEAYIEQTTLRLAGLPASDLGLIGDLRRYGVRLSFTY